MLPALFVSHGAPTLLLDPGATGPALTRIGRNLPRPRAILVVSAHWNTRVPFVTGAERPDTIHDFYGFPDALYERRYPAPGSPALAARVAGLLEAGGLPARIDPHRGLDHGAWVPLALMFPQADVPVVQLSLHPHASPREQFAFGRLLAPLAAEDVLVIGSGAFTHNLHDFDPARGDDTVEPYVTAFADWMRARLRDGDLDALLDYRRQAPDAARAHPTDEHLLPLFVALGASPDPTRCAHLIDEVRFGMLAMDAFAFGTTKLA
jgi:4,5-DOPA dioxygenase extradiol